MNLRPVLDGLEENGGNDDGHHYAAGAEAHVGVEQLRQRHRQAEVDAGNGGGGERVGHAAAEDDVHVHQPIANNRVAEGERDEDQRQGGELHPVGGRIVESERHRVKRSVGQDGQPGTARHPLHLLRQDGFAGGAVGIFKDGRRQ